MHTAGKFKDLVKSSTYLKLVKEKQFMAKLSSNLRLCVREDVTSVPGDGNCGFHVVTLALNARTMQGQECKLSWPTNFAIIRIFISNRLSKPNLPV